MPKSCVGCGCWRISVMLKFNEISSSTHVICTFVAVSEVEEWAKRRFKILINWVNHKYLSWKHKNTKCKLLKSVQKYIISAYDNLISWGICQILWVLRYLLSIFSSTEPFYCNIQFLHLKQQIHKQHNSFFV